MDALIPLVTSTDDYKSSSESVHNLDIKVEPSALAIPTVEKSDPNVQVALVTQSNSFSKRRNDPSSPEVSITVQKSNSFRRRRNDSGEENPFTKRKLDEDKYLSSSLSFEIRATLSIDHKVTGIETTTESDAQDTKNEVCDNTEEALIPENPVEEILNPEEVKTVAVEEEEDEEDPLGFIQIKSAAQWMAVSKRISWNFDSSNKKDEQPSNIVSSEECDKKKDHQQTRTKSPQLTKLLNNANQTTDHDDQVLRDYDNISYDIFCPEDDGSTPGFKPTK